MTWRPLSVRLSGDEDSYDALHAGVPAWLEVGLTEWVREALMDPFQEYALEGLIRTIERRLRLIPPLHSGQPLTDLLSRCVQNEDRFLDVVDFLLAAGTLHSGMPTQLVHMLHEAGSVWTVRATSDTGFELVERVDEATQEAIESTIAQSGRAGKYLSKAWNEAYGRDPDGGQAYRHAVQAVEAAAKPVVQPNHAGATLGTMIGELRSTASKWRFTLEPKDGDPIRRVIETMELLWTSQLDRHGTDDETKPLHASLEQARTAVHLAATLVQWFSSGAIAKF